MPRVFVPEKKELSESSVARFGKVVPLVPAKLRLGLEPDRIKYVMSRALSTFNDEDFLLLDGSSVHCAVAASLIAIERNSMNLLVWNNKSRRYLLRMLTIDDIPAAKGLASVKRVFLANDTHSAVDMGMTKVALTVGMDPDVKEPERLKDKMSKLLANSHADDYLMTSGSKLHNVVASSILSRMHEKVNYLLWNAMQRRYEKRTVLFSMADLQQILSN